MLFSFQLISLGVVPSNFTHIVTRGKISSFLKAEQNLVVDVVFYIEACSGSYYRFISPEDIVTGNHFNSGCVKSHFDEIILVVVNKGCSVSLLIKEKRSQHL